MIDIWVTKAGNVVSAKLLFFFNWHLISVFLEKKRENFCSLEKKHYLCIAFREKHLFKQGLGEVAEWSIAAVLKTVVPRGTRGSNPCLSAINAENQQFSK